MSWSTTSPLFLNPSRDGDSTTALGSLVQCLTTLSVKTFFLISTLNLPWCCLRPLPLVLPLVSWGRRHVLHYLNHLFQESALNSGSASDVLIVWPWLFKHSIGLILYKNLVNVFCLFFFSRFLKCMRKYKAQNVFVCFKFGLICPEV